jgi:hypothetical protein
MAQLIEQHLERMAELAQPTAATAAIGGTC